MIALIQSPRSMETLPLTTLPSERSEASKGYQRVQNEGFIDESLVLAVIAKGPYERTYVKAEDMVLSSSVDDYAGWALPVASPFRDLARLEVSAPQGESVPLRQPAAPSLEGVRRISEEGLEEPHQGSHRWWLLGVSGAMTCMILSLTLLSLAQRTEIEKSIAGYIPMPPKMEQKVVPTEKREVQPALVKVLAGE